MANAASAISAAAWSSGQGRPVTRNHDGSVIHVAGCITGTSFLAIVTLTSDVRQLRPPARRAARTAGSVAWAAGGRPLDPPAPTTGRPARCPHSRGLRLVP